MAEKIEIVLLGTGSAVPTARKNHLSIYLNYRAETMLFDCGEGTQRQIRKAKLNPCKISKIFITHWHGDHVLGIPGLLYTLNLNNYPKTLEIYGPKGTKKYMGEIMKVFANTGGIKLRIKEVSSGVVFENKDFKIIAEPMKHGAPCLAYAFAEKDVLRIDKSKLQNLKVKHSPKLAELKKGKNIVIDGKKINAKSVTYLQKGRKVALVFDTRENSGIVRIAKDADILISEATYLDEIHMAKDYGHLTVIDAARAAKKAKAGKLILVHLSQRYENSEKEFLKQAHKIFKNTVISEDLMRFEL